MLDTGERGPLSAEFHIYNLERDAKILFKPLHGCVMQPLVACLIFENIKYEHNSNELR